MTSGLVCGRALAFLSFLVPFFFDAMVFLLFEIPAGAVVPTESSRRSIFPYLVLVSRGLLVNFK